ncbi:MAG TPA: SelB C-terminal domain-containing protein, partial [Bacillota bacterium]|nr:SelB C-terminal domain-containing protein [Bacillota bacterium]
GIEAGFVVITKIDRVDDELLTLITDDAHEHLQGTFLADAPTHFVDSLSMRGIASLKEHLIDYLSSFKKTIDRGPFRLPIDHVFTVKGQGVVVRGTVYNGSIQQGDELLLLPQNKHIRIRQMQSHRETCEQITAGQRAALNITGVSYQDISRGNVLVASDHYSVTQRIDIAFSPLQMMSHPLKQRQYVKVFVGTSEVMGRIIFFDRNELTVGETEEVVCQIELAKKIVTTRGDRLIVRRPTPAETIGGGWVIEPQAEKYRFGLETIKQLQLKKDGTAKDRVVALLSERQLLSDEEILRDAAISREQFSSLASELVQVTGNKYTLKKIFSTVQENLLQLLAKYHQKYPLRVGKDKAVLISQLVDRYPKTLIEYTIEQLINRAELLRTGAYVSLASFEPSVPKKWQKQFQAVEEELIKQQVDVSKWAALNEKHQVSEHMQREFYHYLIDTEQAFVFDDERIISRQAVEQSLEVLAKATDQQPFTLQNAREVLNLSRKNLIPLLELFDKLGFTKRIGNERTWLNE